MVAIPSIIRTKEAAKKAYDGLNPEEAAAFWKYVDGGGDKMHAINMARSGRAQAAAANTEPDAEATPVETAAMTAGNAATMGGVPTIMAALGHGEGDTFAQRKQSDVGDLNAATGQNPLAASLGEGIGLALPAVGGALARPALSALGLAQPAAEAVAPTLGQAVGSAVGQGAALGVPLGALQTDTGTAGSIAGNALLGGAAGAGAGALGALVPAGALALAPSLGTTSISEAAQAPVQTALGLAGEVMPNAEDLAVRGSNAILGAVGPKAQAIGKWGGAALGHSAGGLPGAVIAGAAGNAVGERLGASMTRSAAEMIPQTSISGMANDVMMGGPSTGSMTPPAESGSKAMSPTFNSSIPLIETPEPPVDLDADRQAQAWMSARGKAPMAPAEPMGLAPTATAAPPAANPAAMVKFSAPIEDQGPIPLAAAIYAEAQAPIAQAGAGGMSDQDMMTLWQQMMQFTQGARMGGEAAGELHGSNWRRSGSPESPYVTNRQRMQAPFAGSSYKPRDYSTNRENNGKLFSEPVGNAAVAEAKKPEPLAMTAESESARAPASESQAQTGRAQEPLAGESERRTEGPWKQAEGGQDTVSVAPKKARKKNKARE